MANAGLLKGAKSSIGIPESYAQNVNNIEIEVCNRNEPIRVVNTNYVMSGLE